MQFSTGVHEIIINQIQYFDELVNWMLPLVREITGIFNLQVNPSIKQTIIQLILKNAVSINDGMEVSNEGLKLFKAHCEALFKINSKEEKELLLQIVEAFKRGVEVPADWIGSQEIPETQKKRSKTGKLLSKHGGVVLLAQFLKPFFTNLDLLEEGQWKNVESQYRALHLINYLCSGESLSPEFNLNIEKLICGIPLNSPVPVDVNLSEAETNECHSLLESILEHWKAVKNTSINGLRQTFLLRDCILINEQDHWKIYVDRKTTDVLLEKLPWSYSVIILPWNNYQIYVEW